MKLYDLTRQKQVTITLTGTSGTATITIDGTDYTATFATSLANTAGNFVTAEAANILAAHGVTVTNPSGADLLFVGTSGINFTISIANATGDLDGTLVLTQGGRQIELKTSALTDQANLTVVEILDRWNNDNIIDGFAYRFSI